jgi:4-amino-4-deoxy-L-arabinose transferase-like glycosyltransferase
LRGWLALGGIAGAAVVLSLAVGHSLFPLGSINHDEPMYVFAARLVRSGHLTLPTSYAPFAPWASGVRRGHVVLKYTPIWPAALAVGNALGSMRLAPAAAAAACVVVTGLLGRELFGRWREGLLAATVLVLSPLFFLQSGTFLPYIFQLALALGIVLLFLGALTRGSGRGAIVRLLVAGFVWGIAVFARQYDALLLAIPLAVAAVVAAWRQPRRLLPWAGWSALGAAVPVGALLIYNTVLMGSPTRNTFTVTGSTDALGFGQRGVFPTSSFNYRVVDAPVSVERTLVQFPAWTFGGVVLVAIAGLGLWSCRRRGAWVWAIAGIAVSFIVGYALFWSPYSIVKLWPGARTLGPFYHLALLIPLTIFGAAGLVAVFDRNRVLGVVTVAVMVVVTAVNLGPRVERNRNVTHQYQAVARMVRDAHLGRAVLFMEDRGESGFESAAPFLENTPSLDRPVLYAQEGGPADIDVLTRFPDRIGARLRAELRPGDALLDPTRFVERVHVEAGVSVPLHLTIVNTVGAPTVVARLSVAGVDRSIVLDTSSTRGRHYDVTWLLTSQPVGAAPNVVEVPAGKGLATAEADFISSGHTERFQRQYPYVAESNNVRVLVPGIGRYLFQYRTNVWLHQDVAATIAEH